MSMTVQHIRHKLYTHTPYLNCLSPMNNIQQALKSTATSITTNANELYLKSSRLTTQLIDTASKHTTTITSTINESAVKAYHTTVHNNTIRQQQRNNKLQDEYDILHAYDPDDDMEFVQYLQQESTRLGEKLPKLNYPVVLVHGFIGHGMQYNH